MNKNNNETSVVIKPVYQRHIAIDENIHSTLSLHALSLYMAFRYQADFRKEDSEIKRSAQFLYTRAKISRPQYYRCLLELEQQGLVLRDTENKLGEKCVFHVARELGYFTKGVSDRDRGVSDRDTDQDSSSSSINTTNSSTSKSKSKSLELILGMIQVYREIFPNNPQPHERLISTTLQKTLQTLIKRWPEADPNGNALDLEAFKRYLQYLHDTAPQFALGEYETASGKRKKNSLETFARWNTLVKTMEGAYS